MGGIKEYIIVDGHVRTAELANNYLHAVELAKERLRDGWEQPVSICTVVAEVGITVKNLEGDDARMP
jgi:hypothetical protein